MAFTIISIPGSPFLCNPENRQNCDHFNQRSLYKEQNCERRVQNQVLGARALGKWVTGPMISLHEPITDNLSIWCRWTDGWTDKSPIRCTEGQTNGRTVEITKRIILKRSQDFYLKFSLRADLPMLSNRR